MSDKTPSLAFLPGQGGRTALVGRSECPNLYFVARGGQTAHIGQSDRPEPLTGFISLGIELLALKMKEKISITLLAAIESFCGRVWERLSALVCH